MSQNRICQLQDHNQKAIHICTYKHCDLQSRWNCVECFRNYIHQHDLKDYKHILTKEELIPKLKSAILSQSNPSDQNYEQALGDVIKLIEIQQHELSELKNSIKQLQQQTHMVANYQQILTKIVTEIDNDDYSKINFILDPKQEFDITNELKQLLVQIQQINNQGKTIEIQMSQIQNLKGQTQISQRNYQTKVIDENKSRSQFYGCHISNNQQYLAYGGSDKYLKIYNLNQFMQMMKIKLNNWCMCCQFTEDSKYLFVGTNDGEIYQYDVTDNFKLLLNRKIHQSHIYSIIALNNQQIITCSSDFTIQKTNFQDIKQNQIYKGHTGYVFAIQFIQKQNIIVSGSADKSIKFWNCLNRIQFINKEQAHNLYIKQLQLIKESENLLSLDDGGIMKEWKIDFKQRNIIIVKQFQKLKIYNFYSVNNDQNLVAINDKSVKILDMDGKIIKQIDHQAGPSKNYFLLDSPTFDLKQLDNINYIIIRSQSKDIKLYQRKL